MTVEGSCLCGNVKFSLDVTPDAANPTSVCHCRPCRKISGSTTSLNLTVPTEAFTLTSGSLKTVKTKHMDEGFEFSLSFCPACGSPIYAVPHFMPELDIVVVQAGTLDEVAPLLKTPATELNVAHRLPWQTRIGAAAQKEKY
ncbi:uncharacterized protein Z519_09496 [Cladophialophora bantiana CBS 173.52]|uniref:CENP-V/GFA domain-containing protein n=1 Tax=Cladophialophora bantiana (strain ATCC 10958 / CBS 173.52 / CDC B-1940 / NIH 8579) TaxID=1442370 RepID=A0A0D2HH35_CLAB1|nr:uncharacterized protein Z519_09496 [Cladophialophora bantiana CBS 173.52]KIW90065.1 hypothetical protein Z519_09496 [Cladophialophora bantiana CBS 173.52]